MSLSSVDYFYFSTYNECSLNNTYNLRIPSLVFLLFDYNLKQFNHLPYGSQANEQSLKQGWIALNNS